MNLLIDSWLSVQTNNKTNENIILLSQISETTIIDISSPRADLKGAIYQFLIGLLQATFAPKNEKEWKKYWRQPPTEQQLEQAFSPYKAVFALDTEKGTPAFMQDFDLPDCDNKDIATLFIDAPGGNTLKNNADHFVKRGNIEKLSPYWAAMALFTLQINAPSGGVGHRVSLRGGGPLTTLVLPPENKKYNSLWHRLWLNIFTQDEVAEFHGNHLLTDLSTIFPWMDKTPTSEKKGSEVTPQQAHPLQAYWSMPRRIRLNWNSLESGYCDVSGEKSEQLLTQFQAKNYGINYAGNWVHPLTPYAFQQGKEPLSIKAQPSGLGYRHWLGLAVADTQKKTQKSPAINIDAYSESRHELINEASFQPRLWAFGYDMDNMKARCWYESTMPLFNLEDEDRDDITEYAQKMIYAAIDVLKTIKLSLKTAWFKKPKKNPNAKKARFEFIDSNFWSITENKFYTLLENHVDAIRIEDFEKRDALFKDWANYLKKIAESLFDQYALSSMNEDGNYHRVMKAKYGKGGLEHFLNGSKLLKQLVT